MRELLGKRIRKRYIVVYLYMLLLLMILLTVASYTWFSLSRSPRVSDLYMFVNTQMGMEIALTPDAEEWEVQLDFRDIVDVTAPLRPVTWSEKEQRFYAAVYDVDGRQTGQWEPLNDSRHANKTTIDGYYIKATFYARTGQDLDVLLSPAVEVDKGLNGSGTYLVGTPVWNGEEILHNNGGLGGEFAVRVGIRATPVDSAGEPVGESSPFMIYEPNCNIRGNGSGFGYVPTPSIDGTETLVPEDRLILQTSSMWVEAEPVQRNVIIHRLGEFTTERKLFSMQADQVLQIDLYIWLEGQDVDCTNRINKAQILASIQFATDTGNQSGMVPIDPLDPDTPDDGSNQDVPTEENRENS